MKVGRTDAPVLIPVNSHEIITPQEALKRDVTAKIAKESTDGYFNKRSNFLPTAEYEKKDASVAEKLVIEAIEKANEAISGGGRKFEFSIHEKTKEIMVKVIDSETDKVIREIPPEKILDLVATIWEMAGILVDERR